MSALIAAFTALPGQIMGSPFGLTVLVILACFSLAALVNAIVIPRREKAADWRARRNRNR